MNDEDKANAHRILDLARAGRDIPDRVIELALWITGDLDGPNDQSQRFAEFAQTAPGVLQ